MKKRIEDAVRQRDGVWPFEPGLHNLLYIDKGRFHPLCSRAEFEECVRRLRNEPLWKDAPNWAVAKAQDGDGKWGWFSVEPLTGPECWWVGQVIGRYRFAGKGEVIGDWKDSLQLRPEEEEKMEDKNDWHERGDLPPVGAEFEFSRKGIKWEELVMLFNDGISFLVASKTCPTARWHYDCNYPGLRFRPLQTERERLIHTGLHVINEKSAGRVSAPIKLIVESLADAGMLKMPEDK